MDDSQLKHVLELSFGDLEFVGMKSAWLGENWWAVRDDVVLDLVSDGC